MSYLAKIVARPFDLEDLHTKRDEGEKDKDLKIKKVATAALPLFKKLGDDLYTDMSEIERKFNFIDKSGKACRLFVDSMEEEYADIVKQLTSSGPREAINHAELHADLDGHEYKFLIGVGFGIAVLSGADTEPKLMWRLSLGREFSGEWQMFKDYKTIEHQVTQELGKLSLKKKA